MTMPSPHSAPQLGELEQQVMNLLWETSPRSVRDVMDALPSKPAYTTITTVMSKPAYTTITTVMQNLKTKNMVRAQRQGRFVLYLPQLTREEYVARQMHQALDASNDMAASILHFVQDLPEEGLEMLRNYLEQS